MPNPIEYRTPPAPRPPAPPRRTKHKNLIGFAIVLLAVGGYVGVSMVQSAHDRDARRQSHEENATALRHVRSAELDLKDLKGTITDDEKAELAELRARDAKEKVDDIGK